MDACMYGWAGWFSILSKGLERASFSIGIPDCIFILLFASGLILARFVEEIPDTDCIVSWGYFVAISLLLTEWAGTGHVQIMSYERISGPGISHSMIPT